MARTILVADPDSSSLERVAWIAHACGYRVMKAQTPVETAGALDGCPITAVLIDEDLLRRCDLRRLLVRAQVVVLSKDRREETVQDVGVVPKHASAIEIAAALVDATGDPRVAGPRVVVPLRPAATAPASGRSAVPDDAPPAGGPGRTAAPFPSRSLFREGGPGEATEDAAVTTASRSLWRAGSSNSRR